MSRSTFCFAVLFLGVASLLMAWPNAATAQRGEPIPEKSFSNLIAALNNIPSEIRAVENQEVQEVLFADVREMRDNLDERQNQRLDEAIDDANMEELHDFLSTHDSLSTALREKRRDRVPVEDVVAIDMLSDGDVVVYFEPML